MVRLAFAAAALAAAALAASCKTENPAFCEAHPGIDGCAGDATNGGACSANTDCTMPGFPLCDTTAPGGACVKCTASDAHLCTGTSPVCAMDECVACSKHSDCTESNTCLPDGSCAASTDVAYLDGTNGTDNPMCTKAMPCTKLDKAIAAKSIIKVSGAIHSRYMLNNKTAVIVADPGASLMPSASDDGTLLDIHGPSDLQIYDLQIANATGGSGFGIALSDTAKLALTRVAVQGNASVGVQVNSGTLICTQCKLTGNVGQGLSAGGGTVTVVRSSILSNMGGGLRITGSTAFHVVSNFVFSNGAMGVANAGGINVGVNAQSPGAPANEITFNSISGNKGVDTGQGLQCTSGTPLTTSNNIVWANGTNPSTDVQVFGNNCSFAYSDIGPMGVMPAGTNLMLDPAFVSQAAGDLHVTSQSPVLGKADPAAVLNGLAGQDIDGDPRVARTGAGADIGADQYVAH